MKIAVFFGGIKKKIYICTRKPIQIAEIAQLVERNLAKVEVAGPSPVFRSEKAPNQVPFSLSEENEVVPSDLKSRLTRQNRLTRKSRWRVFTGLRVAACGEPRTEVSGPPLPGGCGPRGLTDRICAVF